MFHSLYVSYTLFSVMEATVNTSSDQSVEFDETMSESGLLTELKTDPFEKLNALKETARIRMFVLKKKSKILKNLVLKHPLENDKVVLEEFKRYCLKVYNNKMFCVNTALYIVSFLLFRWTVLIFV